jgi:aspartyl-tRNA(Asn)/glutamyl-tRNA(Gln) amidotransferase subunit A
MNSLAYATIDELKQKLENKEISQKELLQYFLDRFKKYDSELNSAIEVFDGNSILERSELKGKLAGIPGLIKDNIAQKDRYLTCGSNILKGFKSTYDSTVTERLKKSGALLIGRANLDEFAMGSSTETSAFGITKNPWDFERVPGGSSGGSIAAVAAGLIPWALGSETGGSVRQPAAFCGIVGLKPTYGLISRYGLVAYASSLDQIGIATRTVKDNALVLSEIGGHDLKDSSSLSVEKKDYTNIIDGQIPKDLKIGIIDNALNVNGLDEDVRSLVESTIGVFEELGAKVKRVTIPSLDYSAAAYFIISRAEAASNLARFDGVRYGFRAKNSSSLNEMYEDTRHDGFGDDVRLRILVGNYVLSAGHAGEFYQNAKKVQRIMRKDFEDVFKDVDVLISPVQSTPAFKFGAFSQDKLQMDLQDYFTCFANLTGLPALALPCGFSKDKLPIGFQLIGPHLSEAMLYKIGYAYENVTKWHKMHPPKFL